MPAKNTGLEHGERFNPLNKALYNRFIDDTCINIDYKTFITVVQKTNEIIKESIVEEEAGVKLPENLGHIIVTKYKSKKTPWDWHNTMKHQVKVPHLNLHSFGYIHHIKWFGIGVRVANIFIYKFKPYRILKRAVAKNIKEGKKYFKWENSDLWSSTKMERRFEKFYNKNNQ